MTNLCFTICQVRDSCHFVILSEALWYYYFMGNFKYQKIFLCFIRWVHLKLNLQLGWITWNAQIGSYGNPWRSPWWPYRRNYTAIKFSFVELSTCATSIRQSSWYICIDGKSWGLTFSSIWLKRSKSPACGIFWHSKIEGLSFKNICKATLFLSSNYSIS